MFNRQSKDIFHGPHFSKGLSEGKDVRFWLDLGLGLRLGIRF